MNNIISFKTMFAAAILSSALLFSIFIISASSSAQNIFDIQFPIPELGNCGSMEECKTYCDDSANADACAKWAEDKGIVKKQPPLPQDEFQRKSRDVVENRLGPGDCQGMEECNAFCGKSENGDECFKFAKEHGLIPPKEIQRIEKEMRRAGPGGCGSREECDAFCRKPDNTSTCLNFAVQDGKISQEEADFMLERMTIGPGGPGQPPRGPRSPRHGQGPNGRPGKPANPTIDMEKAEQLLSTIGGPGGCKTMEECGSFCDKPENEEICFNYAVDNGLMPPEEIERVKKMKDTIGPGGCRGRECEAYCDNPERGEECFNFAVEQGFIKPEEAEQTRKFMEIGKRGGPGNCKGPQECDAYCSQPEHGEECFNFAKDNDLMPTEEIQRMERGREIIKKLKSQGGGPGGCKGQKECRDYCMDTFHFDECAAFSVREGMLPPDKARTMLKEFTNIEERKFERFGPPGFGPESFNPPPTDEFGPQSKSFGPPPGFEQKFEERFKMFEKYQQGFQERDGFCSKPENAEQCRQISPAPMMPPQPGMIPPQRPIMPFTLEQEEQMRLRMQQMQQIPPSGQTPYPYEGMAPGPQQMMPGSELQPSTPPPTEIAPPQSYHYRKTQSLFGILLYPISLLFR